MREGIKLLHAAADKRELAEPGLQQRVQEALTPWQQGKRQQQSSKEAQQRQAAARGRSSREGAGTGAQVQQKPAGNFSGGRG